MNVYDGSLLECFNWIDLFKALVHNSGQSPGEKTLKEISQWLGDRVDAYSNVVPLMFRRQPKKEKKARNQGRVHSTLRPERKRNGNVCSVKTNMNW